MLCPRRRPKKKKEKRPPETVISKEKTEKEIEKVQPIRRREGRTVKAGISPLLGERKRR